MAATLRANDVALARSGSPSSVHYENERASARYEIASSANIIRRKSSAEAYSFASYKNLAQFGSV